MFTGAEFYERLDNICKKNGTTISAFLLGIGKQKSLGSSMKKAQKPNHQVALAASKQFNVPLSQILGTDDELSSSPSNIVLNKAELDLIIGLRACEPIVQETVLRMVNAAVSPKFSLSSSDDGISHHTEGDAETSGARTFRKRIEGEAAAGVPITAVPEEDSFVSVPEKYLDERYFIVRARGDSMEGTIPNGACCVFQRDVPPTDGSIVLVQIEGSTDQPDDTIKRIYLHGRQIELRSDNAAYAPMMYPAQSVQIAGSLVAVLGKYADV